MNSLYVIELLNKMEEKVIYAKLATYSNSSNETID